jgi:hydrogenase/urease accessory protein HupE
LLAGACAAWLVTAGAPIAGAHQEPYSHLDLHVENGRVRGSVTAHIVDLAHEAGLAPPESLLSIGFASRHVERLRAMLAAHLAIAIDGHPLHPAWGSFRVVPERRSLAFDWQAPLADEPGSIRIAGPLFPYDPAHETYVNLHVHGALVDQDLLDASRRESVWYSSGRQGTWAVVRTFVAQGIHHIWIGPDHILFIVGLLLLGGGIGRLLKIVTAFTIAHSITLALATLHLLNPPARLIEPLIALSIVYVGVETLWALDRERDWRAPIAFLFGFVHGFGFASVLSDFGLPAHALGWSLAAFNFGVEIGQACVVLAVAPALAFLGARRPALGRRVVTVGSAVIIAAGGYWFVQRVFFGA